MPAVVIPFDRRRAAPSGWTTDEVSECFRVVDVMGRAGLAVSLESGASDEGDPWLAFIREDSQEVIVHIARIDGDVVAASLATDRLHRARSIRDVLADILRSQPLVMPRADGNASLHLHPAALLAALVATAYIAAQPAEALMGDPAVASQPDRETSAQRRSEAGHRIGAENAPARLAPDGSVAMLQGAAAAAIALLIAVEAEAPAPLTTEAELQDQAAAEPVFDAGPRIDIVMIDQAAAEEAPEKPTTEDSAASFAAQESHDAASHLPDTASASPSASDGETAPVIFDLVVASVIRRFEADPAATAEPIAVPTVFAPVAHADGDPRPVVTDFSTSPEFVHFAPGYFFRDGARLIGLLGASAPAPDGAQAEARAFATVHDGAGASASTSPALVTPARAAAAEPIVITSPLDAARAVIEFTWNPRNELSVVGRDLALVQATVLREPDLFGVDRVLVFRSDAVDDPIFMLMPGVAMVRADRVSLAVLDAAQAVPVAFDLTGGTPIQLIGVVDV